jgi:Fe-S oxidoreductase
MCGRCQEKCPVGIEISPIRMIQRRMENHIPDEKIGLMAKYFPHKRTAQTANRRYLPHTAGSPRKGQKRLKLPILPDV